MSTTKFFTENENEHSSEKAPDSSSDTDSVRSLLINGNNRTLEIRVRMIKVISKLGLSDLSQCVTNLIVCSNNSRHHALIIS